MDTGIILVITVVTVLVLAGAATLAARHFLLPARRTARLKKHFGPEYEHTVQAHDDTEAAEHDLTERLRHHEDFPLRELTERQHAAHTEAWTAVQQEFVDAPVRAVRDARDLVSALMTEIGYPTPSSDDADEGFDERLRQLSVDHPETVAEFRRVHTARSVSDQAPTEDLREALVAHRGLVHALLGERSPTDHATSRVVPSPAGGPEQGVEEGR